MNSDPSLNQSDPNYQLDVTVLDKLVSILKSPDVESDESGTLNYTSRLRKGLQLDLLSGSSVECAVRWLEGVRSVVGELCRLVDDEATYLRDLLPNVASQNRKIEDLPDEVLAHIMEEVVSSSWPPGDQWTGALPLSHVCRRFRSVALNSPSLWVYMSSQLNKNLVSAFLERSRGQQLNICVHLRDRRSRVLAKAFLKALLVVRFVWKSFILTIMDEGRLDCINPLRNSFDFPALQSICCSIMFGNYKPLPNTSGRFYARWACPKLAKLELTNFPVPIEPMFSEPTPKLRTVEILYKGRSRICPYTVNSERLWEMIGRIPSLEKLTLGMADAQVRGAYKRVELRGLSTLELIYGTGDEVPMDSGEYTYLNGTRELLQGVSLPNLKHLGISVHAGDLTRIDSFLHSVLSYCCPAGPFPNVEALDISIFHDRSQEKCGLAETFVLPHLSHLSVTFDESLPELWSLKPGTTEIGPLRSLRLSGCRGFEEKSFMDVITNLAHSAASSFERLEVIRCPVLSGRRQEVEMLLPQAEIIWTV